MELWTPSFAALPTPRRRRSGNFPASASPGAEKILTFTGKHAFLAPESNGLRVLARVGLIVEERSYAATYAAGRSAGAGLPAKPRRMQDAHLLLQKHGRTLCKRTAPRCGDCPLRDGCTYVKLSLKRSRA
jgi:endonuclease III